MTLFRLPFVASVYREMWTEDLDTLGNRPAETPCRSSAENRLSQRCVKNDMESLGFCALLLLVGCQEGHPAFKNLAPPTPKGSSLRDIPGPNLTRIDLWKIDCLNRKTKNQ